MTTHRWKLALLVALSTMTIAQSRADEKADTEKAAVEKANAKFYTALNAMFKGDPKPFEEVWWHTPEIVYMGADGAYNVGWEQTYANWKKQAALKIGGSVRNTDVKVSVGKNFAMVHQYVQGKNTFEGKMIAIKLRATSVLQKKKGQWRMISHHVDVIPPLRKTLPKQK